MEGACSYHSRAVRKRALPFIGHTVPATMSKLCRARACIIIIIAVQKCTPNQMFRMCLPPIDKKNHIARSAQCTAHESIVNICGGSSSFAQKMWSNAQLSAISAREKGKRRLAITY